MKELFQEHRKKIITGVVIVLLFAAYSALSPSGAEPQGTLVARSAQVSANFQAGKEILALLVDLKSIRLDGSLFADPVFQSLEDFSIPIEPEPRGRTNPFAPVDDFSAVSDDEFLSGLEDIGI